MHTCNCNFSHFYQFIYYGQMKFWQSSVNKWLFSLAILFIVKKNQQYMWLQFKCHHLFSSLYKQPLFVIKLKNFTWYDIYWTAVQCNASQCIAIKTLFNKNAPYSCCMMLTKLIPTSFLFENVYFSKQTNHKI